ncbi:MAG: M48 family metalloprotease [Gammaproteobacteria bacterium]
MKNTFLLVLLTLLLASGCATNPVTGENELMLISESRELDIGKQNYAPLRQSQGGDYVVDPRIETYVNTIGQRLAAVSDRQLPYEFRVLNNSTPNAWALPGGKIAINRGLLTELQSEAELAAVLGHEIVHAAAKHSAKGMQRGMLLQGAVLAATIASRDTDYANLAQMGASVGAQLVNQKYGRDAERESDHYGMQYMSKAGYNPQGAVELQETFVKLSESRNQDWLSGLFASHPPSQERVQNNIRDAATLPRSGETGRERYRNMVARLIKAKPAYAAYDEAGKLLADGKTGQAKTLVRKAIAIEPREGHFHSLLGDIERKDKHFAAARRHYDKAINLNESFFYYYLKRGLTNMELDNSTAARRDLERSTELLPTANAYTALGNIARNARDFTAAKQYYGKAAGHDSTAGKEAYAALVEIDLPENPGKYLKVRSGVNNAGKLLVEISNSTPRDVTGLVLALQYPDEAGRVRKVERPLQGTLAAGEKETLTLAISVPRDKARQIRSGIIKAKIAP